MKKNICMSIAFLLIWLCSVITLLAYKNGNVVLGVVATLTSILSFPLMNLSR